MAEFKLIRQRHLQASIQEIDVKVLLEVPIIKEEEKKWEKVEIMSQL